jgi:hypothetical protein
MTPKNTFQSYIDLQKFIFGSDCLAGIVAITGDAGLEITKRLTEPNFHSTVLCILNEQESLAIIAEYNEDKIIVNFGDGKLFSKDGR